MTRLLHSGASRGGARGACPAPHFQMNLRPEGLKKLGGSPPPPPPTSKGLDGLDDQAPKVWIRHCYMTEI